MPIGWISEPGRLVKATRRMDGIMTDTSPSGVSPSTSLARESERETVLWIGKERPQKEEVIAQSSHYDTEYRARAVAGVFVAVLLTSLQNCSDQR